MVIVGKDFGPSKFPQILVMMFSEWGLGWCNTSTCLGWCNTSTCLGVFVMWWAAQLQFARRERSSSALPMMLTLMTSGQPQFNEIHVRLSIKISLMLPAKLEVV